MLAPLGAVMGGVLRFAPGFLGRAFGLVGDSAVRHFLVADDFAGFLFDLARYLIVLPLTWS